MAPSEMFDSTLMKVLTYLLTSEDDLDLDHEGHDTVKWIKDMYSLNVNGIDPFRSKLPSRRPVFQVLYLLRESLLTQRWGEALRLVQHLVKEYRSTTQTVIKVSLELCHQLDPGRGRLLEQLLNQLQSLWGVCAQELSLEYAFFIVCQDETPPLIQEALDTLKLFKKPPLQRVLESDKDQQIIAPLFDAYQGLLTHAQWLLTKQTIERLQGDKDSSMISELEIAHEEKMLHLQAERAIISLRTVLGHTGVWDVFVTKLVQLLEFQEDLEEAERVLISYSETNPSNPNSQRYLCEFYHRHGMEEDELTALRIVARMLPSESCVLDLYNLLKKNDDAVSERLDLLLDLLDHTEWQQEPAPWRFLADELMELLEKDYHQDTAVLIQKCYSSHFSWWGAFHFTPYAIQQALRSKVARQHAVRSEFSDLEDEDEVAERSSEMELLVCKAAVASMFSTGSEFVSSVSKLVTHDAEWTEMLTRAAEAAVQLEATPNELEGSREVQVKVEANVKEEPGMTESAAQPEVFEARGNVAEIAAPSGD